MGLWIDGAHVIHAWLRRNFDPAAIKAKTKMQRRGAEARSVVSSHRECGKP